MDLNEIMTTAQDGMTVRRVFGEPYERDGTTMIPAAIIAGGAGGGGGNNGDEEGSGGGFGLRATPAGAFSIRAGEVRWHPAISANQVIIAVAAVAIAVILGRSRVGVARARAARRSS